MKCPCHSLKDYEECCKPFHESSRLPKTALELMRSRYSAYSLGIGEYIIDTTHPDNPAYMTDKKAWNNEITKSYGDVKFIGLEILKFTEQSDEALVEFRAKLQRGSQDISFTEESLFFKVNGKWLYHSGKIR